MNTYVYITKFAVNVDDLFDTHAVADAVGFDDKQRELVLEALPRHAHQCSISGMAARVRWFTGPDHEAGKAD